MVYSAKDERRSEDLKGVNGTFGHVTVVPLKGLAPGRYVLKVEAQVAPVEGCHGAAREVEVHRTLMGDVETLARGDDSRLVEPRRFLIRDWQAFAAVWAAHAGPNAATPAVDFDTRMVAAVFAGERPTPGFSVEVTGTRRDGRTPAGAGRAR